MTAIAQPWSVVATLAGAARLVMARVHKRLIGDPPEDWIEREVISDGLHLYTPIRERRLIRRGAVFHQRSTMFGPYLFGRFEPAMRAFVLQQPGVRGILKGEPVPDIEIAELRGGENAKGVIPSATAKNLFAKGASVRITDGPFTSFPATVDRPQGRIDEHVDWRGRITKERIATARVLVSIFGRATPLELQESQLERA